MQNRITKDQDETSIRNIGNTNVIGSQSHPLDKLICLNDFVDNVRDYVNESQSTERGLNLIFSYNDFLNQDIKEEMFTGDNTLFPDFIKCTQKFASINRIEKSFDTFGKDEWQVTILRKVGKEYGIPERISLVSSFHLKVINDLVGKIEEYNSFNEKFGWREVS